MITGNDLIIGEYYKVHNNYSNNYLIMKHEGFIGDSERPNCTLIQLMDIPNDFRLHKMCSIANREITQASKEEIHWLNTCIKLNKFIPLKEALLTFVDPTINYQQDPEYNNILIKLLTI